MAEIKLQGINSSFIGIAAKDLKIGDVLVWNFGYKSEIISIQPSKTGKSYTLFCKSLQDGVVRERKTTAAREFAVEQKEPINPVDKAIQTRESTYHGVYSDVGCALDKFTTAELAEYYIKRFGDSDLRYYIEQQIIAAEINSIKAI